MYIVGQERRLVDPPSQVVAGVRTVTTNIGRARPLPRLRPSCFYRLFFRARQFILSRPYAFAYLRFAA
jgi:hypothetical protein